MLTAAAPAPPELFVSIHLHHVEGPRIREGVIPGSAKSQVGHTGGGGGGPPRPGAVLVVTKPALSGCPWDRTTTSWESVVPGCPRLGTGQQRSGTGVPTRP